MRQLPLRHIQPTLVSVDERLDIVEQSDMIIELVSDLYTQLALVPNTNREPIEALILLIDDPLLQLQHLLIIELIRVDQRVPEPHRLVVFAQTAGRLPAAHQRFARRQLVERVLRARWRSKVDQEIAAHVGWLRRRLRSKLRV